jgi:hypothetical protein
MLRRRRSEFSLRFWGIEPTLAAVVVLTPEHVVADVCQDAQDAVLEIDVSALHTSCDSAQISRALAIAERAATICPKGYELVGQTMAVRELEQTCKLLRNYGID